MSPEEARQRARAATTTASDIFKKTAQRGRVSQGFDTSVNAAPLTKPKEQSFFDSFTGSVTNIPGAIARTALNATTTIAADLSDAFGSVANTFVESATGANRRNYENLQKNIDSLDLLQEVALNSYKAGRITKDEYADRMKELSNDYQELSGDFRSIQEYSDVRQRILDMIEVASLPLAGGRITSAGTAGKYGAVQAAAHRAVSKIPNIDDILRTRSQKYVLMNANSVRAGAITTAMKQMGVRNAGQELALAYFLRYPLVIGQFTADTNRVLDALEEDRSGDAIARAAFMASMAFKGGPLGLAYRGSQRIGGGSKSLIFGKGSFYDTLSEKLGFDRGNVIKYLDDLKAKNPVRYKEAKEALEAMQEINLRKAGNNADLAADMIVEHFTVHRGYGLDDLPFDNFEGLLKNLEKYYDNYEEAIQLAKIGAIKNVEPGQARLIALGTFDTGAKKALIKQLEEADKLKGVAGRMEVVERMAAEGVHYTQNDVLWKSVATKALQDDFAKAIDDITTAYTLKGVPKKFANKLAEDGYFIIRPRKIAQEFVERGSGSKIVSKFVKKGDDLYEIAKAPRPVFNAIGSGLRKAGLSPEDTHVVGHQLLKRNVGQKLTDLAQSGHHPELSKLVNSADDGLGDAHAIINRLQLLSEDASRLTAGGGIARAGRGLFQRSEVQDIRLLTIKEVAKELDVSLDTARAVKGAIINGYLDVPVQVRGLGNHIQDLNLKHNPLAKPYARAQSALRYSWNPFFRVQEVVETETLGQTIVGGKKVQLPGVNFVRNLFRRNADEMAEKVKVLEESGLVSSTFFGEAAQDQVLGRVTAVLSKAQKESLAGMVETMAKTRGVSFNRMIADHYDEVGDALRVTVQYSKHGALNSSLATTMNLAFFPVRYNLKVTKIAADALAKQPPAVQLAVLKGTHDMRDWLKSDEGLAWQAENRELWDVLGWITPTGSIAQVLGVVEDGIDSPAELGLLGGLPFGIIGQMLDSQLEDFNLNTPYVDPQSGDVYPDYVPESTKARVRTAVTDLLMSVYTYPGRLIGLPGKGQQTRDLVDNFLPVSREEYNKIIRLEDLTPEQKEKRKFLMEHYGLNSVDPRAYNGPVLPPGEYLWPDDLGLDPLEPEVEE